MTQALKAQRRPGAMTAQDAHFDDPCSLPSGMCHFTAPHGCHRIDPREDKNGTDER